jgi:hypothetical protein
VIISRVLHVAAITVFIGSATYAYSVKYGTIYLAEAVATTRKKIREERDSLAILKAEWQHLNKPDRLQALSQRLLSLQALEVTQIARFDEIPRRARRDDSIGMKLHSLGVLKPTATPSEPTPPKGGARTPRSKTP